MAAFLLAVKKIETRQLLSIYNKKKKSGYISIFANREAVTYAMCVNR